MTRSKSKLLITIALLGVFIAAAAAPCLAAAVPAVFGADWQFNEFSKSFDKNLNRHDSTAKAYFYVGLALTAVLFMTYSYFRSEQRKREIQQQRAQAKQHHKRKAPNDQRREWLRVFAAMECSYVLDTPESTKELIETRLLDLGAGGCKLEVFEKLNIGDPIKVAFNLSEEETLALNGKVARIVQTPKKEGDPYHVGIQFIDVKESERDQIVRWTYKHELNINEEKRRLSEGLCLGCGKPIPKEPGLHGKVPTYCPKCQVYGKH